MMDDLISRQAAIDAIADYLSKTTYTSAISYLSTGALILARVPTTEPTLYGYKIEHLAYIATVMEKEGVTAEYAVRTFDDIGRVVKMIIEEAQAKVEEVLNERFN